MECQLPRVNKMIELIVPSNDRRRGQGRKIRGLVVNHYPSHISIIHEKTERRESFTNKEIIKGIITYKYL